jgi:YgiT-type zinc finger domain-containing protein
MQKMHICHICGGKMHQALETKEYCYNNIPVTVKDVKVFRCVNCGEGILESEEAKRVEWIIRARITG